MWIGFVWLEVVLKQYVIICVVLLLVVLFYV